MLLRPATVGSTIVQVNFEPELVGQLTQTVAIGDRLDLEVVSFPDAHPEAHPVYALLQLTTKKGDTLVANGPALVAVSVRGKVVRLNYARRGEVNGAILDTGDFVHLRSHGVKAVGGLRIGQTLEATGEVRPGWSGTRVLEAHSADGVDIGKSPKPAHPKPKHGPGHHPPLH